MNHPDHMQATVLGGLSFIVTLVLTILAHIQQVNGVLQFGLLCFSAYVAFTGWRKTRRRK